MRAYTISYKNLTKKIKDIYDQNNEDKSSKNVSSFVKSCPIKIGTFQDLIMEIAELSYKNPNVMLFYRGQSHNYIKAKYSLLYPSIYRVDTPKDIPYNFSILEASAKVLLKKLENNKEIDSNEIREIQQIKLLQYSILQHYEVCSTPLLDVTQSLKVACSFAALNNKNNTGYIYVLGLPYITGRISVDSENYITNIRLLSISCSASKRPFFQEGYLVQTEFASSNIKRNIYDFNRRIVAIYELKNDKNFWGTESPINETNLYPQNDLMNDICDQVKKEKFSVTSRDMGKVNYNEIGEFLTIWNSLEKEICYKTHSNILGQGIQRIIRNNKDYEKEARSLNMLRQFRNTLVHGTKDISIEKLKEETDNLKELISKLNIDTKI